MVKPSKLKQVTKQLSESTPITQPKLKNKGNIIKLIIAAFTLYYFAPKLYNLIFPPDYSQNINAFRNFY